MHTEMLKIVGCGGHSKVVLDALSCSSSSFLISLCDSNKALIGKEIYGYLIDSDMESLEEYSGYVHVAIGNNQVRASLFHSFNQNIHLFSIVHPQAICSPYATIGAGSFIAARAILGPDSSIGRGCIVNHGAVLDHEVCVGSFCHIAPNATLGGNVHIGNGVLIGAGANILPGIKIGDEAIIGAGAVVIKDVPAHALVKGIPAR